ncbi:MAG: hypothetical protein IPM51_00885 [Sphingobacteriaceae bacterium]|nr:hypothetical protein [Sphingobacteriaceae bacterium]
MRIIKVWEQEGAAKLNFLPRMNFAGDANKNIQNHAGTTGKMKDSEGNYYYISHPNFAYVLAYGFHQIFQLPISVISLQSFNLILNFLSALFIFLIVLEISVKNIKLSLLAYALYVFNPAVMWFQCNTYMSDILVHFLFISSLYFVLIAFKNNFKFYSKHSLLLYLFLFIMCLTSWLGYLFILALIVLLFLKFKWKKEFLVPALILIIIPCISAVHFYFQYKYIAGPNALIEQLSDRFSERGIANSLTNGFENYGVILKNIILNHGLYVILLLVLLGIKFKRKISFLKTDSGFILKLSVFPVLFCYLFLPDYSGHDFTTLYLTPFVILYIVVLFHELSPAFQLSKTKANLTLFIFIFLAVGWYYGENLPGELSIKGKRYDCGKVLGETIKTEAETEIPCLLISDTPLGPEVVYYSGRNIFEARDTVEAKNFLKENGFKRGKLFYETSCASIEIRDLSSN